MHATPCISSRASFVLIFFYPAICSWTCVGENKHWCAGYPHDGPSEQRNPRDGKGCIGEYAGRGHLFPAIDVSLCIPLFPLLANVGPDHLCK